MISGVDIVAEQLRVASGESRVSWGMDLGSGAMFMPQFYAAKRGGSTAPGAQ
jgi:biotin carboxylase